MMQGIYWTGQETLPILGLLQLLPLVAAALMLMLKEHRLIISSGLVLAALELVLTIILYLDYQPTVARMQFVEQFQLLGPLVYHVGADGITVLFVMLNALLTLMLLYYGVVRKLLPTYRLFAVIFTVEAALMSQLVSLDLLWYSLMSAIQLFIVGYLLWYWSTSPDRDMAISRYLQFMGTGTVLLLIGVFILGWNYADVTGSWSFDLFQLGEVGVRPAMSSAVFFLLFYGLAVRTPLFPLHGWLPVVAEHGSVAIGPVFLLGLKSGIYGMIRFLLPLMPEATIQWQPYIAAFALTGIFYAAAMALLQVNMRRLLAFAVVSHTSVMVIGLFTLDRAGLQGAVMLSVNFGLAITGLFFATGLIYNRTGSLLISHLGGLFDRLPMVGIAFLVAGLAIVGMPGTPGFDAVHLMLEASMHRFGALMSIAAALGNVVAAGFLLWAFQRTFLAPLPKNISSKPIVSASPMEQMVMVVVTLVLLGVGFYSEPWLVLIESSANSIIQPFTELLQHGQEVAR
ncbi:MAG: NADH-quinone oxidoreductase subunit M [Gammaproteobacteria bacterium]|nr:NADH-quinone oxidoreductase subunit M [Gammaproteobacteria bacterium]